ncbi:MAG TPA: VCBS repeat-containing protein, partial [Planctomycetota bacterium]|nr:VCBS repeat-containing protein [Planctomycetota bacterium]
ASGAFPGASLAVGDLSGDGKPDVAVTADDSSAPGVVVMLGTGGGALGPPTKHALSGQHAQSVAMADFDADGHLDLAVGNSSFTVAVLLGLGGGALAPAKDFASESHDAPNVVIGDISGDGRPDIVASGGNASVLLNQNPNIGPWTDLGFGLAGLQGIPIVLGSGTLQANAPGAVTLSNTEASARAFLFVSLSSTPTPFHGGTLAAFPSVREFGLATDAGGKAAFPFTWPAGIPAAADFYFQFAVKDPAGPQGVTLSNALRAVTP